MTQSVVLPSDNAVIDYSIINQIIAQINSLQAQVISNTTPPTTNSDGTISTTKFAAKTISIPKGSTTTQVVNAADLGLTSITTITATIYSGSSARYVWLSKFSSTSATFSFSSAVASGCTLHVVAFGTV